MKTEDFREASDEVYVQESSSRKEKNFVKERGQQSHNLARWQRLLILALRLRTEDRSSRPAWATERDFVSKE